jgi:hypothetical protein
LISSILASHAGTRVCLLWLITVHVIRRLAAEASTIMSSYTDYREPGGDGCRAGAWTGNSNEIKRPATPDLEPRLLKLMLSKSLN